MRLLLQILKWPLCLICLLFITQCSQVNHSLSDANKPLQSPYRFSAATYLAMAENQDDKTAETLKLQAAGRLIEEGQWQQANLILTRLKYLSPQLANEKKLLQAKIDLIHKRSKTALAKLAEISDVAEFSAYQQIQYRLQLARAYELSGNATEAAFERMKLGSLLPDSQDKEENYLALWLNLLHLSASELDTETIEAPDNSESLGWMRLAQIARQEYKFSEDLRAKLNKWREQFSNHPANQLIPQVELPLADMPQQIALLLPLSGQFSAPGSAIRDGFIAARNADKDENKPTLRFYDTHADKPHFLYQQAIRNGAQFVVGPLLKQDVEQMAALYHPVPTLYLNDLDMERGDKNAYQFGLSPSVEAREVAQKARENAHTRALIIAPAGAWGNEVVAAFTKQWQALGGRVMDSLRYQDKDNLNAAIRDILHISASDGRKKALQAVIRQKLNAIPRRRHDVDMIFLLAYPSKARQIMPLLKYYYAGSIPVYATSSVYSGHLNPLKDRDLDGILFCDMPWLFTHHADNRHWPEWLNSYGRLYALGLDSYRITKQLNQLKFFPAVQAGAKQGVFFLNQDGKIERKLSWGTVKNGIAKKELV